MGNERLISLTHTQPLTIRSQGALKQDTMVVSTDLKESEVGLLKLLGWLGDRHQSTEVFDVGGVSHCISATEFKHPMLIVDIKQV